MSLAIQRDTILATRGLGAAMRLNEKRAGFAGAPGWLAECWQWVTWLTAARGLARSTSQAYAATLGGFSDWVQARGLDYTNIQLSEIDEWMRDLWFRRRHSAGHRSLALSAVRSFYDWRSTRGLGRNCAEGARQPKVPKHTPRKYTKQQLQKLFASARLGRSSIVAKRDEVLLTMLYTTGMRREEAATLRMDQLEMDDRICVIRIDGKGAKEREVAIEGPVVKMLRDWLELRSQLPDLRSDTVFFTVTRNWFGQAMQAKTIERVVNVIARRAGLGEWGVHRFRVTFATQLYDDGIDIERIRILLGHEKIETTRRYIAVSTKQRRYRLKAFRQHEVLGTRPEGMPRWAQQIGERAI